MQLYICRLCENSLMDWQLNELVDAKLNWIYLLLGAKTRIILNCSKGEKEQFCQIKERRHISQLRAGTKHTKENANTETQVTKGQNWLSN